MARRNWEEEYSPDIVEAVRNRDYANGGADAVYMSDEDYAATLYDKSLWGQADEAGRSAIHDRAEQRRAGYGYSGGSAGDEYNKLKSGTNFSFQSAPQYISRYQDLLDQLTQQYVNRGPFEYDYATDPRWQAYKKEYTREGRRATEDTLGQYAAMTGGVPSTAAMTAASQAGDYYNARMTDKIPELAQLAYDMYLGEGNQMLQKINALQGMEQADYNQYLNALGQWNTDRNFAYQDYLQGLADERSADEKALAAAQIAGGLGNYGLLENYYGIDPGTWQSLYDAQAAAAATGKGGSGGSSGGRGGSGSGGGDPSGSDESGNKWADLEAYLDKYGDTEANRKSWIGEHYKELGYSTKTQAVDAFATYATARDADARNDALKRMHDQYVQPDIDNRFSIYTPGDYDIGPIADVDRGNAIMSGNGDRGILPAKGKRRSHSLLYEDIENAISGASTDSDYQVIARMLENGYASGDLSDTDYDELLRKMGF